MRSDAIFSSVESVLFICRCSVFLVFAVDFLFFNVMS